MQVEKTKLRAILAAVATAVLVATEAFYSSCLNCGMDPTTWALRLLRRYYVRDGVGRGGRGKKGSLFWLCLSCIGFDDTYKLAGQARSWKGVWQWTGMAWAQERASVYMCLLRVCIRP